MNAYPLSWPDGWARTPPADRAAASFGRRVQSNVGNWKTLQSLTVPQAVSRVTGELGRLGIDGQDVIVSTNVALRLDGLPRGGQAEPEDGGVAVYWQDEHGNRRVLAIDRYRRVADNLAAIAATLEALRAVERHGGARILDRAFTGFASLPAPGQTVKRTWRQVLGFTDDAKPTRDQIRAQYRRLASEHHPDRGGTDAGMAEVNAAHQQALQETP